MSIQPRSPELRAELRPKLRAELRAELPDEVHDARGAGLGLSAR